jgi:surface protein
MEIDSNPTGVGQLAPLGSGCVCTTDTVADASGNSLTSILVAKDTAIGKKADASAIPTKTSQLTNDSGFLTSHQDLSAYAKTADVNTALAKKADTSAIPTKTSQLTNDSGYLTSHQSLADYAKTADVNTALAAKADATELAKKQDTLVSGTNIKTINGLDLLGEGNITIEGGGSGGSGTVTGVSVNGAAAISPDSNGIVPLTDIGSAATIASQAKTIAAQATTIANLQTQIDKYKPHWWAWVTCSHEVNIKINGTTITLPEGRSKIEDFESVAYDASDMDKFLDGITKFDIYSTGSWPLTKIQLGNWSNNAAHGMSNVESIDVSKADLRNNTFLTSAFYGGSSIKSVGDLSNWDTSKVTNMSSVFTFCSSLTSVGNLANWDTSKVTNIARMFYECRLLTSLSVSGWDLSSCTNITYTFRYCMKLSNLILGEGFGKIQSGLTLDLSTLNQYGNDTYSAYVLSDESWASFKIMYDREENGLPAMTIRFSAKHKANYADWDNFVEYMTARGYNITTA